MWWKVTITVRGEENFLSETSRRLFADFRSEPETWGLSRRLIRSLSFFNSAAGKTLPSASIPHQGPSRCLPPILGTPILGNLGVEAKVLRIRTRV